MKILKNTAIVFLFVQSAVASPLNFFSGGGAELALKKSTIQSVHSLLGSSLKFCGSSGDIPVAGNYLPSATPHVASFNPSSGEWQVCGDTTVASFWGAAGDIPVAADYNNDGLNDFAVFRPSTREWLIALNDKGAASDAILRKVFGQGGGLPLPIDFDGDGVIDLATVSKNGATGGLDWSLRLSAGGVLDISFGLLGDYPVPADYDGDGREEITVFRPENGTWYVRQGNQFDIQQFGLPGDVPSPTDFDGDGRVDFVVYRPSIGRWYVLTQAGTYFELDALVSGAKVASESRSSIADVPALFDFDGDRVTDFVSAKIVNGQAQFHLQSRTIVNVKDYTFTFGQNGDAFVPGDYDGDGITDFAVVRVENNAAAWKIRQSSKIGSAAELLSIAYGSVGDQLIPADFDGDGKVDPTVIRNIPEGFKIWLPRSSSGVIVEPILWGLATDTARTADIDGDGRSDFIVIRNEPAGEYTWYIRLATGEVLPPKRFGFSTVDEVVLSDNDGDGKDQIGVVRDVNGFKLVIFDGDAPYIFGLPGDESFDGNYLGATLMQHAVWRKGAQGGTFFVRANNGAVFAYPFGKSGDTLIRTNRPTFLGTGGTTTTTTNNTDTTSGGGNRLSCASRTSVSQQGGGFVWKPVSESDSKLAVLFPSSFAGKISKAALVESRAGGDVVLETLRFTGNTNGNRPTFRASKPGRSYPSGVILVREEHDGDDHCIVVPNPGSRTG